MHILHLRNTLNDGGVEKMLLNWCNHLDHTRLRFSIVCFANPGGTEACLLDRANAIDVPTFRVPWGRRKRLLAAVDSFVRIIESTKATLVHSHDAKSNVVATLAQLRTRVPVVGSAYAWFGDRSVFRVRLYEWLDVHMLKRFQGVVTVSESLQRESMHRGLDPDRLMLIRTGVDYESLQKIPDRDAVRRSLGLTPDDIVIGNLARLWPEKGQSYLLEALRIVVDRHPSVKLVIIGTGPLEERIRAQARDLGLAENVVLAGFPDNLSEVINILDAQVHSSVYEGLPIALLQGMAAGLPIVSTDVGGIREVLTHGDSGLIVPPGNSVQLASAMLELIEDRVSARRMGETARRFVREQYSMEAAMRQLEAAYGRVYADSR
jgi:glycosyltransferase involved in cell wall biosynthesis